METKHEFFVKRNEKGFMELFERAQCIYLVENSRDVVYFDTPWKVYPFEEDHFNVRWLRYKVKKLEDELLKMQLKYEPLPLDLEWIFNEIRIQKDDSCSFLWLVEPNRG